MSIAPFTEEVTRSSADLEPDLPWVTLVWNGSDSLSWPHHDGLGWLHLVGVSGGVTV